MVRRQASSDVFSAIADPTRRVILQNLIAEAQPAGRLAGSVRMTQAAFSQHLRVLREAGLVTVSRAGRERIYSLDPTGLKTVSDWVAAFDRFWDQRLDRLAGFLRRKQAEKN